MNVIRAEVEAIADRALEVAAKLAAQWPAPVGHVGHDLATFIRFRTEIAEGIRALKSTSEMRSLKTDGAE